MPSSSRRGGTRRSSCTRTSWRDIWGKGREVDDAGRREGERPSAFTPILCDLVRSTAGACGAVFTDQDGECVDYFSLITPFDLKVIGAHASLLVSLLAQAGVVISGPLAFSGSRQVAGSRW